MTVLQKLKMRDKLFATMISNMTWTGIIPMLKKRNLDLVIFELEHNHYSWGELEALIRTSNMIGLSSIVRVTDIAYHQISKVLDLGAHGVLIPRIETLAQLEQVIDMMRLPPRGRKGVGGYDFAVDDLVDKLANYNQEKIILIQIESPRGIEELDRMLCTNEVAGVIVGPYDMSMSLGIPGQFDHLSFKQSVQEVIRICEKHKMSCGMFMGGEVDIRFWRSQGMNIIWSGSDLGFFSNGYNSLCDIIDKVD
jgi:2-keto-3-deoxy-L-rhamnonate aldolase RhmA